MPYAPRSHAPASRRSARALLATSVAGLTAVGGAVLALPASAATVSGAAASAPGAHGQASHGQTGHGQAWGHLAARRTESAGLLPSRGQQTSTSRVAGATAATARPTTVVAVRGTTGHMYVKRSTWGHFVGYGGQIVGAPAVASARGIVYYVAEGTDGTLLVRTEQHAWSPLASGQCSEPAIAVNATVRPTRFIVGCRGTDGALYYGRTTVRDDGTNPHIAGALVRQGGHLTAGPAVFYAPSGNGGLQANFLTVGSSYAEAGHPYNLHQRSVSDPVGRFYPAFENCSAQPTAELRVGASYLRTYFGCQTPGSHSLYYETGNASEMLYSYGGAIVGHPGIAVAPDLRSAVFFTEGTDGHVYRRVIFRNGTSTHPVSLGGKVFGGVGATTLTAR